jgi:hypothetical protein
LPSNPSRQAAVTWTTSATLSQVRPSTASESTLFEADLVVFHQVLVHGIFGGERWHVDLRADVRDYENIMRT